MAVYPLKFEPKLGYLRPIIPKVVGQYLDCGDNVMGDCRFSIVD
jgi:hypothetical protein